MKKMIFGTLSAALLLAAGAAFAAPAVQFVNTPAGMVMADTKGMVLYTWDRDTPGASTCTGTCLTNWPLFKAAATDTPGGDWTIVTRPDNERVWAYKTKPVYYYVQDTAPMEIKGNQPTGTWHVIVQGM